MVGTLCQLPLQGGTGLSSCWQCCGQTGREPSSWRFSCSMMNCPFLPIRSWLKGRDQTAARPSKMSRVSRLRTSGFVPSQWALGHRSVPGCLVPGPAGQGQVDSDQNVRAHGGGVGCGPWAGGVHKTGVLPGERLTVSRTRLTLGGAVPVGQQSPDVGVSHAENQRQG